MSEKDSTEKEWLRQYDVLAARFNKVFQEAKEHGREAMNAALDKAKAELVAGGPAKSAGEIGLTVQTLTPELAEQFDAKPGEGVVVRAVEPGSIAAHAGIEVGSIILQVNRKQVKSAAEFQRAAKADARDKRVLLLIRKGDSQRYVALSW